MEIAPASRPRRRTRRRPTIKFSFRVMQLPIFVDEKAAANTVKRSRDGLFLSSARAFPVIPLVFWFVADCAGRAIGHIGKDEGQCEWW